MWKICSEMETIPIKLGMWTENFKVKINYQTALNVNYLNVSQNPWFNVISKLCENEIVYFLFYFDLKM